jgi:hypothetical protein
MAWNEAAVDRDAGVGQRERRRGHECHAVLQARCRNQAALLSPNCADERRFPWPEPRHCLLVDVKAGSVLGLAAEFDGAAGAGDLRDDARRQAGGYQQPGGHESGVPLPLRS